MIHERLRILLKALNMSQNEFAKRINLNTGYVSRIIRGINIPPRRILLLIETVFGVNKEWLENGEGEIFATQCSPTRRELLPLIESLNEEQVKAVTAFVKYLKD